MLIGNALTRESCTGQGPVNLNLVQRRERNHGRGIPDINSRPIARSTPAFQTGKAPDGHTDMREPANKSLLTDVSRLCSYRCRWDVGWSLLPESIRLEPVKGGD